MCGVLAEKLKPLVLTLIPTQTASTHRSPYNYDTTNKAKKVTAYKKNYRLDKNLMQKLIPTQETSFLFNTKTREKI